MIPIRLLLLPDGQYSRRRGRVIEHENCIILELNGKLLVAPVSASRVVSFELCIDNEFVHNTAGHEIIMKCICREFNSPHTLPLLARTGTGITKNNENNNKDDKIVIRV